MPSNIVHNYFAKAVKESLNKDIVDIIDENLEAYLMGSQGPDLLFYLRYEEKPLPLLGSMVHSSSNPYNIFFKSGQYAKGNETLISFLFGQLCHYALDSNIHPYVYHREKDLPNYYPKDAHENIHVLFESGLDFICLRDYMKVNPYFFKSYKNIKCEKDTRLVIARYYSELIAGMFGMTLPVETGEKMLRLMKKFYRIICDDTTGIKYLLIRGMEKISKSVRKASVFIRPRKERVDEDWLNKNRTPYPKYRFSSENINLTVDEMAKNACRDALALINNFYGFISKGDQLDKTLYYRNYCGTEIDIKTDTFVEEKAKELMDT